MLLAFEGWWRFDWVSVSVKKLLWGTWFFPTGNKGLCDAICRHSGNTGHPPNQSMSCDWWLSAEPRQAPWPFFYMGEQKLKDALAPFWVTQVNAENSITAKTIHVLSLHKSVARHTLCGSTAGPAGVHVCTHQTPCQPGPRLTRRVSINTEQDGHKGWHGRW